MHVLYYEVFLGARTLKKLYFLNVHELNNQQICVIHQQAICLEVKRTSVEQRSVGPVNILSHTAKTHTDTHTPAKMCFDPEADIHTDKLISENIMTQI